MYIYVLHILQIKYKNTSMNPIWLWIYNLLSHIYFNQLKFRRKYFRKKKNQKKNFTSSTWAVFPFWYMYPCTFMFCTCFSTKSRSRINYTRFFSKIHNVRNLNCPAGNYMFKVNNRNSRTRCGIRSKLTIKTPERRQWHTCSSVSIVNFEQVNADWVGKQL